MKSHCIYSITLILILLTTLPELRTASGQTLGFACDDDKTAEILITGQKRNCGFLSSRNAADIRSICGDPSTGARSLCRETCGLCTDDCEDIPGGTFLYDRRSRPCSWLATNPDVQQQICRAGQEAYDECPEVCDRCDKPLFTPFQPIRINVGGGSFEDGSGKKWQADFFASGGRTVSSSGTITNVDSRSALLYKTARVGADMLYTVPVPNADYRVTMHFAETNTTVASGNANRVFNVVIEGRVELSSLNVAKEIGAFKALTKTVSVRVKDDKLDMAFRGIEPMLSGLEITLIVNQRSQAVPGGPYMGVDVANTGTGSVLVDASRSFTYTPYATIRYTRWVWLAQPGSIDLAGGIVSTLNLPVGKHKVRLDVIDTDGHISSAETNVEIKPFGFPFITSIVPNSGTSVGGEKVVIYGSGFRFDADRTNVRFGSTKLTGASSIRVVNSTMIELLRTPGNSIVDAVAVRVETPLNPSSTVADFRNGAVPTVTSNAITFRYFKSTVKWTSGETLSDIDGPTCVAFGPDGKLYVGTTGGILYKLTLNENFQVISKVTSDVVNVNNPNPPNPVIPTRAILGITFDPMDASENAAAYISHSWLFHTQPRGFFGKVSKVSGQNLQTYQDVITGLPVSDYSHAVNGLEFGDNGELYIQVGGITNAGVPGGFSTVGLSQPEEHLSAATLVAYNVTLPGFDGIVTYDSSTGEQVTGLNVQVFAPGQRNSFDIVLHSNGNLYATDNGPNLGYGKKLVDCSKAGPDPAHGDKLNLIRKNSYYGHANRRRGQTDPRQCTWRDINEAVAGYTRRIADLPSSSNGIIEWQTDHFGGALRGHLIVGQWGGPLFDITLGSGGTTASVPQVLINSGGLNLVQAPSGAIVVSQHWNRKVIFHKPSEVPLAALQVKSVYPRRGGLLGDTILSIYGENFDTYGTPTVIVGGQRCAITGSIEPNRLTCRLPPGRGTVDVLVSVANATGTEADVLIAGYRYIQGPPVAR